MPAGALGSTAGLNSWRGAAAEHAAAVKVNTTTNTVDRGLGLYFVGLLNSLGYKATLQALSPAIQYPRLLSRPTK